MNHSTLRFVVLLLPLSGEQGLHAEHRLIEFLLLLTLTLTLDRLLTLTLGLLLILNGKVYFGYIYGVFVVGQHAEVDAEVDDFDNIDGAKDVDESDCIGARRASARGCEESAAERDRTARARGEGER